MPSLFATTNPVKEPVVGNSIFGTPSPTTSIFSKPESTKPSLLPPSISKQFQESQAITSAMVEGAKTSIQSSPPQSFNPIDWVKDGAKVIGDAIQSAADQLNTVISDYTAPAKITYAPDSKTVISGQTTPTKIASDIGNLGIGTFGALLSPISAVFTSAAAVPGVVGLGAKGVNAMFSAIGAGAGQAGVNGLQNLPFLSDEQKQTLEPFVRNAAGLVGQIIAGKGVADATGAITEQARLNDLNKNLQPILSTIKDTLKPTVEDIPVKPTVPIVPVKQVSETPPEAIKPAEPTIPPVAEIKASQTISPDPLAQEAQKYAVDKRGIPITSPFGDKLPTNPDGTITVYHRTTPEIAAKIKQEGLAGSHIQGEQGKVYVSTNESGGQNIGKEKTAVLKFNIDPKTTSIDESYRNGTHDLVVNANDLKGIKPIDTSLDALKVEAQKYKSAEEFVKAQDQYVYHNSSQRFLDDIKEQGIVRPDLRDGYDPESFYTHGNKDIPDNKPRTYLAEDPKRALNFGGSENSKYPETKSLLMRVKKSVLGGDTYKPNLDGGETWYFGEKIKPENIEVLKDGEWQSLTGKQVSSPTKSQLTDFYNKVKGETTVPPKPVETKGVVPVRTAKSASDISTTMAERGYDALPQTEQAQYSPTTKAEQIQKTADVLKNMDNARAIIRGEQPLPNGVKGQVLWNAVEKIAMQKEDPVLIDELAKSPLASARSIAAQELGSSAFNQNPHSPVEAIREISKAREDSYIKKTGVKDIVEAKKKVVETEGKSMNSEIRKAVSKRQSWEDFTRDLLTCKS